MKRLLDETTDDLTRALLEAGAEHRPPPGSQAKLLVALGAGSALGLFSSNAFAWLGSTGGKLTLLGVTLGVAGAVYVALPSSGPTPSSPTASGLIANSLAPAAIADEELPAAESARTASEGADEAAAEPSGALVRGESAVSPSASRERSTSNRRARSQQRRARRATSTSAARTSSASPQPVATEAPASASGAVTSAPESPSTAAVPSEAATLSAEAALSSRLDREVELVDDMRRAERRQDMAELKRLVELYQRDFPEGQLRQEVAAFGVRSAQP